MSTAIDFAKIPAVKEYLATQAAEQLAERRRLIAEIASIQSEAEPQLEQLDETIVVRQQAVDGARRFLARAEQELAAATAERHRKTTSVSSKVELLRRRLLQSAPPEIRVEIERLQSLRHRYEQSGRVLHEAKLSNIDVALSELRALLPLAVEDVPEAIAAIVDRHHVSL